MTCKHCGTDIADNDSADERHDIADVTWSPSCAETSSSWPFRRFWTKSTCRGC